jgi:GAF domain-containing protein
MLKDTAPERLFAAMLAKLVELTGAEKGFVIVMQDGERHLAASHNVEDEKLDITKVSDSIVNQVVEHLQPLIVSDAATDNRFARAKSVVDLRLSSVMCVPLIYRRDLLGVIYLGNDQITDLFTDRDLGLLKIYAAQASLVVYHALQLNQLRVDNRNLRSQLQAASLGEMIGSCAPMKAVFPCRC